MQVLESYVQGAWKVGTGKTADLHDPTTGEAIATCSTGGIDMGAALAYARDVGGPNLREMTFAKRAAMLAAASRAIFAQRDALIEIAIKNGGNTRKDAKFDIDGATGTLAAYAEWGAKLGETHTMLDGDGIQLGRTPRLWCQHVLQPRRGAAVHVNAFNFPGWGLAEKAAVAWLAGMPVVSKPATATAVLADRVVRILVDAKVLPDGAISLLCGSAGDLLDHMESQDVLAFTGSSDTAYLLRSKERLLRRSVRVNVEADSLNAAILGPDVEPGSETWNLFLRDVVTDMTQKAGQKCTAIRRVFCAASAADAAIAELAERLSAVKVGDPAVDGVGMGPVSTAAQLSDVRTGIAKLATECDLVLGGVDRPRNLVGVAEGKGWFVAPTLFRSRDAKASKIPHEHEVFGPAATLLPYDGSVAAVAPMIRRGDGGLVASVYSDDKDFVQGMVVEVGAWHGRLYLGSANMAPLSPGPGTVLPGTTHGGPGRAGGGEELGVFRGMSLYQQRTALEGDRALIDKCFPRPAP